ncbi:TPA: hypothetical protein QH377_004587, partial [Enterobacter hormaechei subsp. steigerwaltii]|nr:hypothetical protein [Enterobacter hormaechei subsp. steigerwaltii]
MMQQTEKYTPVRYDGVEQVGSGAPPLFLAQIQMWMERTGKIVSCVAVTLILILGFLNVIDIFLRNFFHN